MKIKPLIFTFCFLVLTSACTQSGRRKPVSENETSKVNSTKQTNNFEVKNVIKMKMSGGVYLIPAEVNGSNMDFIFDTGASSISISETEAIFLIKQGKITEEDILGKIQFQDATGNISEGTRINLKKVKIGNKTIYDVEASVVHNLEAPLLLGQSVLSRFGKLTIDYNRNEIIFD